MSVCHLSSAVTRIHSVYWNTTNPIFRIDNSQHIVDVNEGNEPWEYDQLNIICPHNSLEKHVIYSVSEEEYNSCRVINPKPKIVAVCDKPKSFIYVTITFRSFSPTPGSLEFKPGQNYYFISTSTQRDIHRRVGGFCSSHNMKMIFKVADNQESNSVTGEEESTETEESTEKWAGSSPFLRAVKPTHPTFSTYSTSSSSTRSSSSSSSVPVYYYRSRTGSKTPREYNYYYSARDLLNLRKKILARTGENETLKAEKLLSSSSSSVSSVAVLGLLVQCWLVLYLR